MQATQAQQGAPAPLYQGTIAKDVVAFYLAEAAYLASCADALRALYARSELGAAERDAIWEGHWATKEKSEGFIKRLRDFGGLLFVGSPVALDVARKARAAAELRGEAA